MLVVPSPKSHDQVVGVPVDVSLKDTTNEFILRNEVKLATGGGTVMVCVKGNDVLDWKLLSPLYRAVIECEPTERDTVERVAVPPLTA